MRISREAKEGATSMSHTDDVIAATNLRHMAGIREEKQHGKV